MKLIREMKLAGFAGVMAAMLVSPASAAMVSQTLTFSGQAALWPHGFSFAPFVAPTATAQFTGLHLLVSGSQITGSGILDCKSGSGGTGMGAVFCNGTYFQQGVFSLQSPSELKTEVADLTVEQTGLIDNVREDDIFAMPPIINAVPIAGATVTNATSYANNVPASGGTLDPALFTGPGNVDLVFQVASSAGSRPIAGGVAVPVFGSVDYSMTVSLIYDYTDVPEPASLGILGLGILALAATHRRGCRV